MKLMPFAVVLAIATNAVLLDAQGDTDCVPPLAINMSSLPIECGDSAAEVGDVLGNITRPNFTDIDFRSGNFCMPQCVQPFVDYYTCLGETDLANIFDGLLCGEHDNESCVQLWSNVFNLNDTNPDGISYLNITQNCRNPLLCNDICSTELNNAVDMLGCCLAGIVEFGLCGPLEKLYFEECSIQIPEICSGSVSTPTTPAPVIPTTRTNCVHPNDDTNYPAQCIDSLNTVENIAITVSSEGITNVDLPADLTAVLDKFCTLECLGPLVDYYTCTGEPGYANAINGFLCGRDDTRDYCLVTVPPKFGLAPGSLLQTAIAIRTQCDDVLECSQVCSSAINTAKTSLGCCLAGIVEFTICGTFEQVRFDECGIDVGGFCPGVDLTSRATDPPSTAATTESGGVIIAPFSLTLLSIVSLIIAKFA